MQTFQISTQDDYKMKVTFEGLLDFMPKEIYTLR